MKSYLFLLLAMVLISSCSEESKEVKSDEQSEQQEPKEEELDQAQNRVGDTTLLVESASVRPLDYQKYTLKNGELEVWFNDEKVDFGSYHFNGEILVMDLNSQTNELEYTWQIKSDSSIVLKQNGESQELICALKIK